MFHVFKLRNYLARFGNLASAQDFGRAYARIDGTAPALIFIIDENAKLYDIGEV
jgi:hypothetical protein